MRGKGQKTRLVLVPPQALPSLRALPLELSYWQWEDGFQAAGLGAEVTPHCLRHTYASRLINAGVDILTLSKLMGHANVAFAQRYARLYTSTLKKAVRGL